MKRIKWNPHLDISLIPLARNYSFTSRNAMWYSKYEYHKMVHTNFQQIDLEKTFIPIHFSIVPPILRDSHYNIRHNYLSKLGFGI